MDSQIEVAKHRAEVAKLALPEIEERVAVKILQVNRLAEREGEFRSAALLERAAADLGEKYIAQIKALRLIAQQLWGLRDLLGLGGANRIEFPSFALPALANEQDRIVARDRSRDATKQWQELVDSWRKAAG